MRNNTKEESKKSVSELDKILDTAVAKLVAEGWTLSAILPNYNKKYIG